MAKGSRGDGGFLKGGIEASLKWRSFGTFLSTGREKYTHPSPDKHNFEAAIHLLYKSKNHPFGWFFDYNYLYFLLRAASDFFLRLTLGFS